MRFGKSSTDKAISNGFLLTVGFMFNKAISFIMIPVLTRILSTSDYGKVSTYLAWVTLLAYIIGMALEYSVRNAYVDYKNTMEQYMAALCGLSITGGVLIGSSVFVLNRFFFHQMNDVLCVCCILHAYVHALVNYMNMKFTMYRQYLERVLILVLPNLFSSILGVFLIMQFTEEKYMGRVWGFILIFVPLGIIVLYSQFRKGRLFYHQVYWKYALFISIPMIAHGLSNVVLNNFDRILLSLLRNDSEAGIYSLVYNFSMIAIAITVAIENIWIPWFTSKMEVKQEEQINKGMRLYIYIVVVLISGILMIAPEILMAMSAEEYWVGKTLIVPIVLSSFFIFLYSLHVAVEIYYKASKYTAFNTLVAALINIVLDILLIPDFGMIGAAYTTLITYIVSFLMHYRYSRKLNSNLYPFNLYVLPLCIMTVTAFISFIFIEVWMPRWVIACILLLFSILLFNKRERIVQQFFSS